MNNDDVYLNGAWLARASAQISVFDRGFIFGDGVYELVQSYNRKCFRADLHIARLERSLAAIGIPNPHSADEWEALFNEAATKTEHPDARIYLQVTRGSAPRRHCFPAEVTPTVFMFADELILPGEEAVTHGLKAVTETDFRWLRGDIKSISLMAAVLASEKAAQADATETIFIRDGVLTEGASSNVLVAKDGSLLSPVLDPRLLTGITLTVLAEIAEQDIKVAYRDISEAELRSADEIMISSSGKEIVPITTLDDQQVGDGKPGPMFAKLYAGFNHRKEQLLAS